MSNLDEKTELKKYLLGNLKEVEAIEKRILADEDYFQELEMVEEELIQDFADGNLSASEKALFEQNFVLTPERANKLSFAKNLRTYIDKNPERISKPKKNGLIDSLLAFFSSPIPVACAVMLIAGIAGYFVWNQYFREPEILASLNKVQKNERPTEGRITGFNYAPKTEGTRGANDKTENLDLVSAKARAAEALLKNETAENYHELGRVYLAESNFDEAIKNLEKGIKKDPNIAELHNDLGVSLMEKGSQQKEEGSLELYSRANESFEKSFGLDKNLKVTYFNSALVIELLNLPNQAKEAWEKYLKLDSNSKWAEEARERLKKLEENKPISRTKEEVLQEFFNAQEANNDESAWKVVSENRYLGAGKLIPQQLAFLFINSKLKENKEVSRKALEGIKYASELEKKNGDSFWEGLFSHYSKADSKIITSTKKAQDIMVESAKMRLEGDLNKALDGFQTAKKIFIKNKNWVEEKICENWIGTIVFQMNKVNESNTILLNLAEFAEENNYKWLATQSYIRLAYNLGSQFKHSQSIEYNQKALKLAQQNNDKTNQQRIYASLAEENRELGQFKLAFIYAEKSVAISIALYNSIQTWVIFEPIIRTLKNNNSASTAIIFQKEALKLAQTTNNSLDEQLSLMYLGSLYLNMRDYEQSKRFFEESLHKIKFFESQSAKDKAYAFTNLNFAYLEKELGNVDHSLKLFQSAIDFYKYSDFQLHRYESHKGKLFCLIQKADTIGVREELPQIIEIFDKYRKEIIEAQNRDIFFDKEQDIYDIATDFEFSEGNFVTSFDYAEDSRSRSLLDLQHAALKVSTTNLTAEIKFRSNLSSPLKLNQIQNEMAENTQLLVYSVLATKLLIWVVDKERVNSTKVEISNKQLSEKILTYVSWIRSKESKYEQIELSKELYGILISKIKPFLDANKETFIVPDKILFHLPFNTLFSDKYLIEEFNISYSPSANVFLHSSNTAKQFTDRKTENLLSIGNPAFNPTDYENKLVNLPSAKQEAENVAVNYQKSNILTENSATKEEFKKLSRKADVIHFAGHYLIEEKSPLLSSLVLAGGTKKESSLANYEILEENLSHIRLIILSACETGIEKYYKGEGLIGASRTFLAKNVPLVIASQWKVDSEATKELMIRFHQIRKTSDLNTSQSLRLAQLEILKSEKYKDPYYWAAFVSLGGYTEF